MPLWRIAKKEKKAEHYFFSSKSFDNRSNSWIKQVSIMKPDIFGLCMNNRNSPQSTARCQNECWFPSNRMAYYFSWRLVVWDSNGLVWSPSLSPSQPPKKLSILWVSATPISHRGCMRAGHKTKQKNPFGEAWERKIFSCGKGDVAWLAQHKLRFTVVVMSDHCKP